MSYLYNNSDYSTSHTMKSPVAYNQFPKLQPSNSTATTNNTATTATAAAAAASASASVTPSLTSPTSLTTPQNKYRRGGLDNTLPKLETTRKNRQDDISSITPSNSINSSTTKLTLPPRRVWVKKPQTNNPTTVLAYVNDIIDDLKVAVVNKYPNTIGRYEDAADLLVKIDLNNIKVPVSPSVNRVSQRIPFDNCIILEPDQNVWQILDNYFPNGMTMHDALIIETPTFKPDHQMPTPITSSINNNYNNNNNNNNFMPFQERQSSIGNNNNKTPGVKHPQPIQPNYTRVGLHKPYSMNRTSFSTANNPVPSIIKDRSVSPSNLGVSRNSPVSHKRSYSNPVASPNSIAAQANNPSAVLLLPRNFSLANNNSNQGQQSNNSTPAKKNLSEDGSKSFNDKTQDDVSSKLKTNPDNTNYQEKQQEQQNTEQSESGFSESSASPEVVHNSKAAPLPLTKSSTSATTTTSPNSNSNSINNKGKSGQSKSKAANDPTPTDIVLPSISVLVVEDNAINQAILGAFLRKRKIHYQIAKNGQEAIDKWKKGGFHLVLMDIQLPVKSGIEATKEIRHLEKLNRIGVFHENEIGKNVIISEENRLTSNTFRSPVIIVALTASSNSSVDKTNALTAGCNDYLTKPVNLVWLQNKITEWGCMQALIDFDGWKDKNRRLNKA
ncbi:(oxidative stress) response regulator, putative [Candida dubliniensis CD36]|uniref:(Oxidative stress) response regulator, putative n=1 Tax=Candida dubliniensis (strain CD36 / ATCC MYA-646 / CBS 7987 / NCPF 3949 / NRRL Y-17841) TaxID=573826 RepID=B9WA10_CANDC|nr:(oxidative stress) response regulator, putative [Candida dubliniensis CD36]CAX45648.1 (oxidative stress) response regulator, putative [Candida dubliniensis CD36]